MRPADSGAWAEISDIEISGMDLDLKPREALPRRFEKGARETICGYRFEVFLRRSCC